MDVGSGLNPWVFLQGLAKNVIEEDREECTSLSNAGAYFDTPTCPDLHLDGRVIGIDLPQEPQGHSTRHRSKVNKAHNDGLVEVPALL